MIDRLLWVAACLVLPVVWGIAVHLVFESWRPRAGRDDDERSPSDYTI